MTRSLPSRLFKVEPYEIGALAWSCAYFFCLLSGYYILRPFREAMAAAGGVRNLKWLYLGTLTSMLIASVVFAAFTTRYPRRRFVPYAYRFFAVNILIFFALFKLLPETGQFHLGRVFFVWVSVYNLFVVSVFWSFMADIFTNVQGKRLFAFVAVGGTLGQIGGSFVANRFAETVGAVNLLLVTVVLLEGACWCVHRLGARHARPEAATPPPGGETPIGGSVWAGLHHVIKTPYLAGIALFILCYTVSSTFLYVTKLQIGSQQAAGEDERVAFFANIDFWTGVITILAQLFLTSRLIARLGVGPTLGVLPLVTLVGFGLLGIGFVRPELLNIVWVLVAFEATRRAGNYAISRPAREVLFTVLPREDKYKSKNVLDTFVYRGGDQVGIWVCDGLIALKWTAAAICFSIMPLAAVWFGIALVLGRAAGHRARRSLPATEPRGGPTS
jgi:AAA family ATP:ADP antiporter